MTFYQTPQGRLPEEVDDFEISMANVQTIEEWSQEPGMPVVLDPDGFDREDPRLVDRLFTEEEFLQGASMSTVMEVSEFDFDEVEYFEEMGSVYDEDW